MAELTSIELKLDAKEIAEVLELYTSALEAFRQEIDQLKADVNRLKLIGVF